jgi:hypothetical protein
MTVRTADSLCAARAAARTLAAIFRSMSKVRSGQCFTHTPPRIHSYTTVGYICPSGGVEPSHPRAETARRRATRSGHARGRALVWLLVCRAAMAAPPEISDPGGLTGPQPQLLPHLRYHITRHVEHDQDPRAKHCSGGALLPRPEYDVRAAPHTSPDSHIVCCDELRQGRRLSFRSRSLCNILVLKFMFYAMPPRASSGTKVASLFTSPCTLLMIPSAPLLLCIPNANP